MRSTPLAAPLAALLFAASAGATDPRALLVHAASPGAPAETTWIAVRDGGGGVRVLGDGGAVRVAPPATVASQRYIVRLTEPASAAAFVERVGARRALDERFLSEIARREPARFGASGAAGIRVVHSYTRLIAGVALEAPATAVQELRATPGVASVEPDRPVQASLDRSVPQVRGDLVRNLLHGTGRGVRVGLVDTGIDYHHPAFGGAFGPGNRVAGGEDLVNGDGDPMDDNGHGTHVAGIIGGNGGGVVGMAVEATLYAYKALNAQGGGFTSVVIAALERCADPDQDPATDDHLDVVNLSLGAFGGDPDDAFSAAVDALDALGTTVVVAAGNGGAPFSITDPAIARGALAVGATMRADTTASFSSRGPGPDLAPKPDLLAPGDAIVSAAIGGGKVALSGTSMAAPHVAGAAALLRQLHPAWTHAEIRAALVEAAVNLGRPVVEQGAGRLDAYAAATATLLAVPSRLAFGRVLPGSNDTTLTRTLELHSFALVPESVTLRVTTERLAPGVDVTVDPAALTLPPGADTSVTVRATLHATRAVNLTPPFAVEGLIEIRTGDEVRHVPYSLHDCFQLRASLNGGGAIGVVHDEHRVWPSKGPFESTWLLPPGDYDAMAFGSGVDRPILLAPGIHLAADRDVDLSAVPADRTLTWSITDATRRPLARAKLDLQIRHESGASLGYIGFTLPATSVLPEAGPGYRLEWGAYQDDGAVRHDIAGTVEGPFQDATVANDPARLKRVHEHFAVTPGDSVLPVEFRLHPDGTGGEFGVALVNAFAPPTLVAYDVVQVRSPTPYPGHYRLGRWDWQFRPAALQGGPGDPVSFVGPPLAFDHGDTVGIHRVRLGDTPLLALTGTEFDFGSGPAVFNAGLVAEAGDVTFVPALGRSARVFSDMLGTKQAGPATHFDVELDGNVVLADTLAGEGSLEAQGPFQRILTLPPGNHATVVVHGPAASVAGTASVTTVRAGFDLGPHQTMTPILESFAVIAGGSVAEDVRFGQVRAPHVEFTARPPLDREPIQAELFYRGAGAAAWTPLAVAVEDGHFTAPLVPADGPVSLRLHLGTASWGTLEMDVEPAFFGHHSPAVESQVLEVTADAAGVHVDWRVPPIDGPLVVERTEVGGSWTEVGEATPTGGNARFEDATVVPGHRYGYRLAGATAVAWVEIPVSVPHLALAIAPNPARGQVTVALGVDQSAPIDIALIDLQGRVVAEHRLASPTLGVHVVNLLAQGRVAPGLYFVRLTRGSDVLTRRVTLLR